MPFLLWHYSTGLKSYVKRWFFLLGFVIHYFSLPLLIPTLFSPWKRLVSSEPHAGFRPDVFFQQLTFNIISRGIGAAVRILLLLIGFLTLIPVLVGGLVGLAAWLVFPPVGLPNFYLGDKYSDKFYHHLKEHLGDPKRHPVAVLFGNAAGQFVLNHVGLELTTLVTLSQPEKLSTADLPASSFSALVQKFNNSGIWDEQLLRNHGVDLSDLLISAKWWDTLHPAAAPQEPQRYGRPGIGLELLYGYTPQLNQYVTDLSVPQPFSHHLIGRAELVSRMDRTLTSGRSLILVGQPGVGKKTITLEFARRAAAGQLSPHLVYHRVLEFDFNFLLSESFDLNQKKSRLQILLEEAADAGNVILVIKDLHRITNNQVEGLDFTDIFEKYLEKRTLKIIAIATQQEYERFLALNSRLRKYFETIEASPPSSEVAMQILFASASDAERLNRIVISTQALRAILEGSDRYITETPFPEKALELLDHVITYLENEHRFRMELDDVNHVLSEKTGISLARLTQTEKKLLGNLEQILHTRLVGQDVAITLIAKSLRARTVGVKNESRPIGSFLFLGPTGVGKTETAKVLAEIYYGSGDQIIRFDMAEFGQTEGVARLIGSVALNQPGVLTTAIKNRPASLLLLDEIEKAPPEVYNLFLTLLDEGYITDAFGKKIICRHLFVIATTNAAAEYIRQQVMAGIAGQALQDNVVEHIKQQRLFSPEFLNRFDGVVVYEPLSTQDLLAIARLMLSGLRDLLLKRNIILEITEDAVSQLAKDGYRPEYGARLMRRIVDIQIGDLVGKAILDGSVHPGDKIQLQGTDVPGEYRLQPL